MCAMPPEAAEIITIKDYKILLVSRTFSDNNAAITNLEEKWKEELF